MKNLKKFIAVIMAVSMLATVMTGCTKNGGADSSASLESSANSSSDSSSDNRHTDLSYTDPITAETVMTVNDYPISLAEYRYYFLNLKAMMDNGDNTYWDGTATEASTDESGNAIEAKTAEQDAQEKINKLKETTELYIKSYYATNVLADKEGIKAEDNQSKIDEEYNSQVKQYGGDESAFSSYLDTMYCTPDLVKVFITAQVLGDEMVKKLYGDTFKENDLSNYVHASHILIQYPDSSSLDYTEKEIPEDATDEEKTKIQEENTAAYNEAMDKAKAEKKAQIDEVLQKIKDGADFNEMIKEYNEDPGETANEDGTYDGYVFTTGEMVEEFEKAAFALKEGEVSDVIETSYGYHIIKRLPMDESYIEKNLGSMITNNSEYSTDYNSKLEEEFNNMTISYDDCYESINVKSLT